MKTNKIENVFKSLQQISEEIWNDALGLYSKGNKIAVLRNTLNKYHNEYFKKQKVDVTYDTDEFIDIIKRDWFFGVESPDFFIKNNHNSVMRDIIKILLRDNKYDDVQQTKNVVRHYVENIRNRISKNEEFIRPLNIELTFYLDLPINDDIPTFEEYERMHTVTKHEENIEDDLEIEMQKCLDDLKIKYHNINNDDNQMTIDFGLLINNNHKSKKQHKIIEKYDIDGNLIETYDNRQECIEKNGLKKSALSLHLCGKRKTLNGYIYKEKKV